MLQHWAFTVLFQLRAVADRDPIMHKYMLLNLDWKVVDVDPLEKVLEYLSQLKNKE